MGKETTLHDDVKQELLENKLAKIITDQFCGAQFSEIEQVLDERYEEAQAEQEKSIKQFMKTGKQIGWALDAEKGYYPTGKPRYEEYYKEFSKRRRARLTADYEAIKELLSMLKNGKKLTLEDMEAWSARNQEASTLRYNPTDRKIWELKKIDEHNSGDGLVAPTGKKENQLASIYDTIIHTVWDHREEMWKTGNNVDFSEQAAREIWETQIWDYLKENAQDLANSTPKTDDDRPGAKYEDRLIEKAELRLRTVVAAFCRGDLHLPGIKLEKTTTPTDIAKMMVKIGYCYTFMTPEERVETYYSRYSKRPTEETIATDNERAKKSIDWLIDKVNDPNSNFTSIYHSAKLLTSRNSDLDLAIEKNENNYNMQISVTAERVEAYEKHYNKLYEATKNNGVEQLKSIKADISNMRLQFTSMYQAVKELSPHFDRQTMLYTFMDTLGRQGSPEKAEKVKANVLAMADSVKRTFWQKIFFKNKNKYSDDLRTMVKKYAKMDKGALEKKDIDKIRRTAENLRYSIIQGNTMTEKRKQELTALDWKRLDLANNVLNSLAVAIKQQSPSKDKDNEPTMNS